MAGTWPYVDMADLEARVRQRADLSTSSTNPQFVSQAELQNYIQKSWEKFYNYLVGKYEDYFVKVVSDTGIFEYSAGTGAVVADKPYYSFPTDYFKLIKIDVFSGTGGAAIGGSSSAFGDFMHTLRKIGVMQERIYNPSSNSGTPTAYVLFGRVDGGESTDQGKPNGFKLVRTPDRAYALEVYYIPRPPVITTASGSDVGTNFIAGWDEYLVLDAAIKCKDKREEDVSVLLAERNDWKADIEAAIIPRDAGQPFEAFVGHVDNPNEDLEEMLIG